MNDQGQGEVREGTGLMCFKDDERFCNASCMAYLTVPPPGDTYKGEQWAHCLELVSMHQTGRHLVIIANLVSIEQTLKKRAVPAPVGG